jgi:hypothetical protein
MSVDLTPIMVETQNNQEVLDANGNPIRVSGSTLQTGPGGHISVTGVLDIQADGVIGQVYKPNVTSPLQVDTSTVDVTSTQGAVNVTGLISANATINIRGADVSAMSNALIKVRGTTGDVTLAAPQGTVLVAKAQTNTDNPALVDAPGLIHLFGDSR